MKCNQSPNPPAAQRLSSTDSRRWVVQPIRFHEFYIRPVQTTCPEEGNHVATKSRTVVQRRLRGGGRLKVEKPKTRITPATKRRGELCDGERRRDEGLLAAAFERPRGKP